MADYYGPNLPPVHRGSSNEASHCIGPTFPPGFRQPAVPTSRPGEDSDSGSEEEDDYDDDIGPTLHPHLNEDQKWTPPTSEQPPYYMRREGTFVGPSVPSHLRSPTEQHLGAFIGPSIPHLKTNSPKLAQIGMMPPSNTTSNLIGQSLSSVYETPDMIGPSIPSSFPQPDDDYDDIGPKPWMMMSDAQASAVTAQEVEQRSRAMRDRLEHKDSGNITGRESWMTELPPETTKTIGLGLVNRSFRPTPSATPSGGDRSAWTDTPADRERRAKEGENRKRSHDTESFSSMFVKNLADHVNTFDSPERADRGDSLMDQHTKKLKKSKKDEPAEQSEGRRPFDRDLDLKVNRFDNAQRQALIKKSQDLDTRFQNTGSQFL